MNFSLKAYSIWEFGQRKDSAGNPHQEDSLYPPFGQATEADRLFIVCDGMGGHSAGEVASEAVCSAMAASILAPGRATEGQFSDQDLADALKAAYDALDARDNGDARKMGTTMTLLKLHAAGATIAHIGDSRVYHIRPGLTADDTRILYVTEDHSLVNSLVRAGHMTHQEAMMSGQKNVITRAMQPGLDPRPHADVYHTADIQPGDFFLLCSDGMLEHPQMEDGSYLRHLFSLQGGSPREKVDTLVAATVNNSDNHTAIVVEITDVQDPSGLRAAGVPGQGEVVGVLPAEGPLATTPIGLNGAPATTVAIAKPKGKGLLLVLAALAALLVVIAGFFAWRHFAAHPEETEDEVIEAAPNEGYIEYLDDASNNGKIDDKENSDYRPADDKILDRPQTEFEPEPPMEEEIVSGIEESQLQILLIEEEEEEEEEEAGPITSANEQ